MTPAKKKVPARKKPASAKKKPARSAPKRPAAAAKVIVPDVDRLITELRRQHDGDPWHGPSRSTILADVSSEEAAWQPGAGAHSIWENVLHMRSWTREVERRALGGYPAMPKDGDWPAVLDRSDKAWTEAQASLDAAHEQLVAVVRKLGGVKLGQKVGATRAHPNGTGITNRAMLYSLASHDIYHSGQVSLLKRLARAALEVTS